MITTKKFMLLIQFVGLLKSPTLGLDIWILKWILLLSDSLASREPSKFNFLI